MKTISIYQLLSLSVILLIFGCNDQSNTPVVNTSDPIAVTVAKVASKGNQNSLIVSGTIQSANSATLSTRTMSYVDKIHVNVGDNITKGQLLLSVNSNDLKAKKAQVNAAILEATAAFKNAKKDYERFKSLFDKNSASQKELDDMTARYDMAKARLQAAEEMKNEVDAQFAYTNIRAPFNGKVASKLVEVGTLANPGMPLLLVESPSSFEVVAKIPESVISDVKTGMKVDILVSSIEATFKGQIKEVSSSSALSGGQYLTTIEIIDSSNSIRSGMFASVQFPKITSTNSVIPSNIMVPKEALITRGQLTGIYTVSQQNTAVLRWLRVGNTIGDNVEILSGLKEGETYIMSSQEKLYNGATLTIQ